MELEARLSYLENVRDWQTFVEELEKGIVSSAQNADKAQFHLKLGRVLETKFLAGVKALKHFQDAYKLNPALIESLESARSVYWGLGKLNMVQKLLELELKAGGDSAHVSALLVELGDVMCDQGDWEKAAATYARALGASGGKNPEASACLEDAQVEAKTAKEHLKALARTAKDAGDGATKARALLRATRVARRFTPDDAEVAARARLRGEPGRQAGRRPLRGAPRRAGALRRARAGAEPGPASRRPAPRRAALSRSPSGRAGSSGTRTSKWAPSFLEEALRLDAQNEGAFYFLREAYGKKAGDWTRVLDLAEEAATRVENGDSTFLLAQAGTIAWRQLGNLIRARLSFERLSAVSPEHPQLRAFEAQIGETPQGGCQRRRRGRGPAARARRRPRSAGSDSRARAGRRADSARRDSCAAAASAPRRLRRLRPAVAACPRRRGRRREDRRAARQLADKQEAAKRYNEYVKTLLQLAALVGDPDEKVALYSKAADLYITQVREPGRGREGLRVGPRDRPGQRAGRRIPAADVREASRLGEAPRSAAPRGRAHGPRGEPRGEVPRDREARDRAGQEARGLHRISGKRSSPTTTRTPRRSARSPVSTSARRTSRSWRPCSSNRPRSPTTRPRRSRSSPSSVRSTASASTTTRAPSTPGGCS